MNDGIRREGSGVGENFDSGLRPREVCRDPPETGIGIEQSNSGGSDDTLLLCGECDVVYPEDDDWNNCPRCGDELREVEQA